MIFRGLFFGNTLYRKFKQEGKKFSGMNYETEKAWKNEDIP